MRTKVWLLALLSGWCVGSLSAQEEELTNSYFDLLVKGQFTEEHSPMQDPASAADVQKIVAEKPAAQFFCFTEDRKNDIRLMEALPAPWVSRPAAERTRFQGSCAPGEYYSWQIGVYAPYRPLENLQVQFSDFRSADGKRIPKSALKCINLGGVNKDGKAFRKTVSVGKDSVQALWIVMNIPETAQGTYRGTVKVQADNTPAITIDAQIDVEGAPIANHGTDEAWRKARLGWLDSSIGLADSVTKPYIPVQLEGHTISYLGGTLDLSPTTGLPTGIVTRYGQDNLLSDSVRNAVLGDEIRLVIETADGEETLSGGKWRILSQNDAQVSWQLTQKNKRFNVLCTGTFEYDGTVAYQLKVTSLTDIEVRDIRLEVPYTRYASRYWMGLGNKGGYRPDSTFVWHWNVNRHQDKIWMGNVNAGLNFVFKGGNYRRPLVNIYYALGKLKMPDSWGNDGLGGIDIADTPNDQVLLTAFSGPRAMQKGESLQFDFDMTITPLKPLNLPMMATEHFYHSNSDVSAPYIDIAAQTGATMINIHHKKDIYPYINYPYHDHSIADFKAFIEKAHARGLMVRPYYTTRELTVKTPELWALRSLGGEVICDGPGKDTRTMIHKSGPNPWLIENLKAHFIPAWYCAFQEGKYKGDMDISVITTPDSRWNNYYLEGLDWMIGHMGIDGMYIDDSALDHKTLQRARRILDRDGKHRVVDIHTWNHMNPFAGYANSIQLYIDLLPYVDRLWIGEGFQADNTPDFWLVEMSGIPFGLMSETLDAHNTYRGMVFGMLPRLPWSGNPVSMWRLWDDFGMKKARLVGFWDEKCPVKTDNPDLVASIYVQPDKALIAVANWTDLPQTGTIQVDEKLLGFTPSKISLPEVRDLQWGKTHFSDRNGLANAPFSLEKPFEIMGREGMFILLEK